MRKIIIWTATIVVLLTMVFGATTLVNTSVEIVRVSAQRLSQEEIVEEQNSEKLYDRKIVQSTFSKERPAWTKVVALIISLIAIPLIPLACIWFAVGAFLRLLKIPKRKPKVKPVFEEEDENSFERN